MRHVQQTERQMHALTRIDRPMTDDEKYAAILRRDLVFDGAFVYSVRTPGIFCRPSCAARPARRENVVFHMTISEAGYTVQPAGSMRPRRGALA
jgi:AraC family transcriptional regulator of adaptative response/methylated-DNA-[protein]-cysteine methyltransferase